MSDGSRLSQLRVDALVNMSRKLERQSKEIVFDTPSFIVSDGPRHALATARRLFHVAAATVSLLAARPAKVLLKVPY